MDDTSTNTATAKSARLRRIGEIADASGLTVRALRYYEEIGLLAPAARSDAGQRLYGPEAVERLYRISTLRQLGLDLDQVRAALSESEPDLASLMADQLAAIERRLVAENRLRTRLVRLVHALDTDGQATAGNVTDADAMGAEVPDTDDLLHLLEDMTMLDTTIDSRIAILVYKDLDKAFDYLTRVFGFGPGELTHDPDGNAVHGAIEAGDGTLWLHPESEEFGLLSPSRVGAATGTMAVMVGDVDAHHRHAVAEGATIRYEPVDQPYGYREYSVVDLEGHAWSFMKPLD